MEYRVIVPPRVALYLVCLRMKAWYFTVGILVSFQSIGVHSLCSSSRDVTGPPLAWVVRRTLCAEEFAGNVEGLASDNDNLLAVEELLSDGARKTTKQVSLAINDDLHGIVSHVLRVLKCGAARM